MSVYNRRSITLGKNYISLSADQMLRLRNYLIFLGLADPILPKKFYSRVNEDTYLADLLGLHKERDGKSVEQLSRIYSDAANIAPTVVEDYVSLLMRGLTVESIQVIKPDGEADEAATERIRDMFNRLDEGNFELFASTVIEAGTIYGDMFVAMQRDADGNVYAWSKEAPAVFPLVKRGEPTTYVVNFGEYESGAMTPSEWAEYYSIGQTQVYYKGAIQPALSGDTGIDEAAMAWAPLLPSRAELWGKSAIAVIVETIVDSCGVMGSSIRMVRQGNAITIISGVSANQAVDAARGYDPESKTYNRSGLDSDSDLVLVGDDIAGQRLESNVGANATTFVKMLEDSLKEKCPVFAMRRLGANASGEALKLVQGQLDAVVQKMRLGVERLFTNMARIGSKLQKQSWETGTHVRVNWPQVFPETKDQKQTRILALYGSGLIPASYAAQELGISEDELVRKHLEQLAAKAEREATAPASANPFLDIIGGGE